MFWDEVIKLKPKLKNELPMEVHDEQRCVTNKPVDVIEKWKY